MTAATIAALVTVALTVVGTVILMLMVNYLPESPIRSYINQANSFWVFTAGLGYFLPIDRIIAVFESWIIVMGALVVYKIAYELISKIMVE